LSWRGALLLLVYVALLVCAALATWVPMLRMVAVDMQRSGYGEGATSSSEFYTLTECMQWLTSAKAHRKHSLFFVAYKNVCDSPTTWYISSQLLLFVLSYASWLWLAGPSRGLPRRRGLACLWIGFAGAISVSLAAVQAAAVWVRYTQPLQIQQQKQQQLAKKQHPQPQLSPQQAPSVLLWLCILLGVLTLPALRYGVSSDAADVPRAFKISLLVGHLALLLPFLQSDRGGAAAPSTAVVAATSVALSPRSPVAAAASAHATLRIVLLYAFLAGLSLAAHLESVAQLWPDVQAEVAARLSSSSSGPHDASSLLLSFASAWYAVLWPSSSDDALARRSISADVALVYALMAVWLATEGHSSSLRARIAWTVLVALSAASLGLIAPISLLLPLFLMREAMQEHAVAAASLSSLAFGASGLTALDPRID
jgi:hypothetical protein